MLTSYRACGNRTSVGHYHVSAEADVPAMFKLSCETGNQSMDKWEGYVSLLEGLGNTKL